MANLLAELEGVVRLSERATPGPFVVDDYADVTANSEDVARIVTSEDDAQQITAMRAGEGEG